MHKERITIDMTIMDGIVAMVEGNPGAINACINLMETAEKIDPDAALGQIYPLFSLDSLGIYGSRIYMLWSDVCDRQPQKVLAILRAYQLGQLCGTTEAAIHYAIDNRGAGLDLDAIMTAVQTKLPKFNNHREFLTQ